MKDKTYDYSSTQIDLNEELAQSFLERGTSLVSKKDLTGDGFEDNPHVTVLYGIHDLDPTPQIIDIIETYPKFSITLGNISLFKEETYDVVKVDVDCSDLFALRNAFMNNCYFTSTFPEYIPHMTVAFVKPDSCDHLIDNPSFKGLTAIAEDVVYSCKDGKKRIISLGLR